MVYSEGQDHLSRGLEEGLRLVVRLLRERALCGLAPR